MPILRRDIMPEEMSVAEALNETKRIDSLVNLRAGFIRNHSSKVARDPDIVEGQEALVTEQAQSARDLIKRYTTLKMAIQKSNLIAEITLDDMTMTVAEGILYKQSTNQMWGRLLTSFNDHVAQSNLQNYIRARNSGVPLTEDELKLIHLNVEYYYDANAIREEIEYHTVLLSKLDVLLDASNHKTYIEV